MSYCDDGSRCQPHQPAGRSSLSTMTSAASLSQSNLANPLSSLSRGSAGAQPTASTARWSTNPPLSTSRQPGVGASAGMSTPGVQGPISNKPFASFAGSSASLKVVTPQPLLAADDPYCNGSTLGSLMPTPSARQPSFQQQALQHAAQRPTAPQSYVPYPAQERLYYQAEFRKHRPKAPEYVDKSRASASTENIKPSITNVEDAPPKSSLYEMNISPGLKYLHKEMQRPSIQSPASFHPMDVDQVASSSPAPKTTLPNGDTEVTVFGFPASASASVLAMFRQIGAVERHEIGAGNWIHIRYASSWSANKALSKNGRLFPTGAFMIGVMPAKEARKQLETASESFMTPIKGSSSSFETPRVSFNLPANEPENVFLEENATTQTAQCDSIFKAQPQDGTMSIIEDDSIVARLVKYVFGW